MTSDMQPSLLDPRRGGSKNQGLKTFQFSHKVEVISSVAHGDLKNGRPLRKENGVDEARSVQGHEEFRRPNRACDSAKFLEVGLIPALRLQHQKLDIKPKGASESPQYAKHAFLAREFSPPFPLNVSNSPAPRHATSTGLAPLDKVGAELA
eukprot:CAMPEP_0172599924 /NCGR_PEP_ID=MMETSP1068-20121228/20052_1 /TAXON_ID=35684 /ORGANISM="Pseudopedinella elastica, Strain CCMP716" /LENGTH=150 /DNA_ID=CAMNT_0013400345 /DNA_START=538 /DNA_END=992 /DNA_ORIENTATION=-